MLVKNYENDDLLVSEITHLETLLIAMNISISRGSSLLGLLWALRST